MSKTPKHLDPETATFVIDSREQIAWHLAPNPVVVKGLKTADYSILGFEKRVAIERKSLPDFIQCCTYERERFLRELGRLREYEYKAMIIEAHWSQIALKQYRGETHPNSIFGSVARFAMKANLAVIPADDYQMASRIARHHLKIIAGDLYEENPEKFLELNKL